jgi:hypothetical protein
MPQECEHTLVTDYSSQTFRLSATGIGYFRGDNGQLIYLSNS